MGIWFWWTGQTIKLTFYSPTWPIATRVWDSSLHKSRCKFEEQYASQTRPMKWRRWWEFQALGTNNGSNAYFNHRINIRSPILMQLIFNFILYLNLYTNLMVERCLRINISPKDLGHPPTPETDSLPTPMFLNTAAWPAYAAAYSYAVDFRMKNFHAVIFMRFDRINNDIIRQR
jgi:hypothetical protein